MSGYTAYAPITSPMTMAEGRLFYIIGASGSGKDSLIRYAREHLPHDACTLFAHRYITRAADAGGENHIALNRAEFHLRLHQGCFSMHWDSHNTLYGIGKEIDHWMAQGLDVVVNGSRAYLDHAMQLYPNIMPVWIHVSMDKLRQRLQQRGRETEAEIEERIALAKQLDHIAHEKGLEVINNNNQLHEAGAALLALLSSQRQQRCA